MITYYTLRETANLLGVKIRTLRWWIQTGKLKAFKHPVSNRWLVSLTEIERLKKENA